MVLKFIDRNYKDDFLREVRALATVRGIEGLQQVEAVLVEGMRYAIVSRYAGATLYECVREKLLSWHQLEDVLQQLRAALERMHQAGVAHRNFDGRNVCVSFEDRVRAEIIDFGSARFQAELSFEETKRIDLDKFAHVVEGARNMLSRNLSPDEDDEEVDWARVSCVEFKDTKAHEDEHVDTVLQLQLAGIVKRGLDVESHDAHRAVKRRR